MARKGSTRAKCKAYSDRMQKEKNKKIKLKRHLKRIASKQLHMESRRDRGLKWKRINVDGQAERALARL